MVPLENKFKAEVVKTYGTLMISTTQEYRVMMVKDPELGIRIALQLWWDDDNEWVAGKGFFLRGRQANSIGKMLRACSDDTYVQSDTQEYRVQTASEGGTVTQVSINKWWRKSSTEDWNKGKGFDLTPKQSITLGILLIDAGREVLHLR